MIDLKPKRVSYAPVPEPIKACCEAAHGRTMQALPAVRAATGERGYILHSEFCECEDRWLPFDWTHGHAEFESLRPAESKGVN